LEVMRSSEGHGFSWSMAMVMFISFMA
jgi:hypothetical protein